MSLLTIYVVDEDHLADCMRLKCIDSKQVLYEITSLLPVYIGLFWAVNSLTR